MKSSARLKTLRILLILLACVSAALPAAAMQTCAAGFAPYFFSATYYAATDSAAIAFADQACISLWSSPAAYTAAASYAVEYYVLPLTNHSYRYECWKCSSFPGPRQVRMDLPAVMEKALSVRPGKAISASLGEVAVDEGTSKLVYQVDIQQGELIVRVEIDAETGEVNVAPLSDQSDK